MFFELPALPFEKDALKPYISEVTITYHYEKHHRGYVNKLNKIIEENSGKFGSMSLEDIIKNSSGPLFNNAAQVWNHTFYWNCLSPKSTSINIELEKAIQKDFGSLEKFLQKFKEMALSNFGSGWTWLIKKDDGSLEIINTSNANTPIKDGKKVLLTCDVWEHAYYLDTKNDRSAYIDNFVKRINWDFVYNKFKE